MASIEFGAEGDAFHWNKSHSGHVFIIERESEVVGYYVRFVALETEVKRTQLIERI